MKSLSHGILTGCNRYHNAELLKYSICNVSCNLLWFLQFRFFSLMERVLTWPTLVTQTGEFSAMTWANHNRLSRKLSTLWDAVSLLPPAPTLTSRWVTSRSNVANGRVTAGSDGLLSRATHIFPKGTPYTHVLIFQETKF